MPSYGHVPTFEPENVVIGLLPTFWQTSLPCLCLFSHHLGCRLHLGHSLRGTYLSFQQPHHWWLRGNITGCWALHSTGIRAGPSYPVPLNTPLKNPFEHCSIWINTQTSKVGSSNTLRTRLAFLGPGPVEYTKYSSKRRGQIWMISWSSTSLTVTVMELCRYCSLQK